MIFADRCLDRTAVASISFSCQPLGSIHIAGLSGCAVPAVTARWQRRGLSAAFSQKRGGAARNLRGYLFGPVAVSTRRCRVVPSCGRGFLK